MKQIKKYYLINSFNTLFKLSVSQTHLGYFSFERVGLSHVFYVFLLESSDLVIFHSLINLILLLNLLCHFVVKLLLLIVQFVELYLLLIKQLLSFIQSSYFGQLIYGVNPILQTVIYILISIWYFDDLIFIFPNLFINS